MDQDGPVAPGARRDGAAPQSLLHPGGGRGPGFGVCDQQPLLMNGAAACADDQPSAPQTAHPFQQVAVLSNHQNGRDTHVRGARVFGPRPLPRAGLGFPLSLAGEAAAAPYATVR